MKRKVLRNIVLGLFVAVVIIDAIFNAYCFNKDEFWNTSFTSCISLIIAVIIGYSFSKRSEDEKRQKEVFLNVLMRMQDCVNSVCLFAISKEEDITVVLMKKREMNNYVTLFCKYSKKFGVEKEVERIRKLVEEYSQFFGEHQQDIDYLEKSESSLKRPLELIDQALNEVMFKLFD